MMASSPYILAIGDSLIAGYGLSEPDSFPAQLERRLHASHPTAHIVNAGVSGDTTADVLRRLPAVMSRLQARPDLAILQVGPNDVLRQVPPAVVRASLEEVLVELQRCGVPVLLTTVDPPAILRDRAAAYLGIHSDLAARHGAVTAPFFPEGVLGHPAMVLADRMHPNAAAISAVVEGMLPTINGLLEGKPQSPLDIL
jgi:acyl-CoA thioesterase-1